MASHQLAIAKASFSAGLLRPDPTSIPRDSIEQFHSLLNAAITQCTPTNIQKCKHWILQNITQSTARFTSLGKYLIALATSFSTQAQDGKGNSGPSIKRKKLHLLYLVNDILHHAKVHNDVAVYGKLQPVLVSLVGSAASVKGCPKHQRKIRDLLDIWEENDYYSAGYINKLREAADNAVEGKVSESSGESKEDGTSSTKTTRSAPFVMPATHGDVSTPWFDLPAANLMPHIVPNSTRPINPDMIKPLQFVAGPADESLVVAVKSLLDDVEAMFGEKEQEEQESWDIDELGQPIILDEITGEILDGEGYYGWSRRFCEKMTRRKKGLDMPGPRNERRSRSRSRSSSRSVRKRRYSSSDASSPGGYRNRRRRRSYTSSRSPSSEVARKSSSRRPERSPSRSRSPRRSMSPPRRAVPYNEPYPSDAQNRPPFIPSMPSNPMVPMHISQSFNPNFSERPAPPQIQQMQYGMQGFNGQGPPPGAWPVPPVPPPNMNFNPSQPWPPPPPPGNPPLQFQQQFNQQFQGGYPPVAPNWQQGVGRGYNNNNNNNNNNGWNNGPPNPGRGNFRGRGRGW